MTQKESVLTDDRKKKRGKGIRNETEAREDRELKCRSGRREGTVLTEVLSVPELAVDAIDVQVNEENHDQVI